MNFAPPENAPPDELPTLTETELWGIISSNFSTLDLKKKAINDSQNDDQLKALKKRIQMEKSEAMLKMIYQKEEKKRLAAFKKLSQENAVLTKEYNDLRREYVRYFDCRKKSERDEPTIYLYNLQAEELLDEPSKATSLPPLTAPPEAK
jgi:hypothetical protein